MNLCIIQARIGSSRFNAKVLAGIGGRPMLEHVIERSQAIPGINAVALCIPDHGTEEEILVGLGQQQGVAVFRNQRKMTDKTNDVLGGYLETARALEADVVMRVTADCPLLCPELSGRVLDLVTSGRMIFGSNAQPPYRTYPDGLDVEAFTMDLLETAALSGKAYDREHVTPSMLGLAGDHGYVIQDVEDWSAVRWTVDLPADLEKIRAINAKLPDGAYTYADTRRAAEAAGVWP